MVIHIFLFFFFKQKTAYELRISDWSSDVCSSDLFVPRFSAFLDGMAELLTLVEINHGDTPRLLLGHSMGGLIATLFLVERQQAFVAAALSGPAILPAEPPSRVTVWISRLLSRFFPRLGVL